MSTSSTLCKIMTGVCLASVTHDALRALVTRDDAASLAILRTAAADADQFIRRTAIEIIGRHPNGQGLRDVVLTALTDTSDYVVRASCEVIKDWAWNEAHDAVARLLRTRSPATRQVAIRALGTIWRPTDFEAVHRIYNCDADLAVKREAAWVLRAQATAADWQQLFEDLRGDDLPRHRVWACELAAAFGAPTTIPIMDTLCADRDGHVRKAAEKAITTLRARRSDDDNSDAVGIERR
ncbi:HEAT repeat domain-containing protein [Bradyrhizobium sp. SRS-191]|uniref:HEAT repeat domain-containing protein n=1 Tax=Bradyrhizobium sp. SRS-191 TaxID=2962606 RepID=UPI00211DD629|nr:HEAT repeat domain-containing protein [Bradyrhizobium sp. SRS-191]